MRTSAEFRTCDARRAKSPFRARTLGAALLGLFAMSFSGCMSAYKQSVGGDIAQVFSRIYLTDYNNGWLALMDSIKGLAPDVTNPEGGFIQTRWTENTSEKNFIESFGAADAYLKAQYRLKLSISKGFYNGTPSVKISVQKEQVVQSDVLEGWRPVETDGLEERTLLYRIGRLISIRLRQMEMERRKTEAELAQPLPMSSEAPATKAAPAFKSSDSSTDMEELQELDK